MCQLHSKVTYPSSATLNEYLLPRLQLAYIEQALVGGQGC